MDRMVRLWVSSGVLVGSSCEVAVLHRHEAALAEVSG